MGQLIDYKGLQVVSPTPGDLAGAAMKDDFEKLADRAGPVHQAAADPTANDDSANTAGNGSFYVWSKWLNTSTEKIFICVDATATAAVWKDVTSSGGGGGSPGGANLDVQFNDGGSFGGDSNFTFDKTTDALSITGSAEVDNLKLDGNTLSATDTNGNVVLTPDGTGNLVLDGLNWPTSDGSANQVLTTDGSANLSWATGSGGGGTVYPAVNGRLTLATGNAVPDTDQTAQTTLYFTPYQGNLVTLYDGSAWQTHTLTERSISLSGQTADTNYDVFLYDNSGTLTLELVAWSNDTTRATSIVLQDGRYVKSGAATRLFLGTIRTTSTTGQCEDSIKRRFVWNNFNRIPRALVARKTTSSWTYNTAAWRAAGNDTTVGNTRVEVLVGLQEQPIELDLIMTCRPNSSTNTHYQYVGVSVDAIGAPSTDGVWGRGQGGIYAAGGSGIGGHGEFFVGIGFHYLQWIEYVSGGTAYFYSHSSATSGMAGSIKA